jgi:alpha-glucosidase
MKTVRTKLVVSKPVAGRIDARRVDATTEADLKRQAAEDDAAGAQDADPGSVLNFARAMLKVRNQSKALRLGSVGFPDVPEPLLAIRRNEGAEEVLCLFNLGTAAADVPNGLGAGFVSLLASSPAAGQAHLPGLGVWIGRR